MKSAKPWDIFCRVVDNYGDIGVCWRLAADLAARGRQVRLWVDDPRPLSWMAPGALDGCWPGVRVMPWEQSRDAGLLARLEPAEVWIEGFGCEIAAEFLEHRFYAAQSHPARLAAPPVWINLEYLSAESFVERAHGLPSPVMAGPAKGHTRYFFYPGFTTRTGGLLREPDLTARQTSFDRGAWLASHGIPWQGEQLVALFCYEQAALADLLAMLRRGPAPTRLLVTAGRATAAMAGLPGIVALDQGAQTRAASGVLSTTFLPHLTQIDFDHLLWSSDLNFVRGEDSLVRAVWAGKPFVWQIYPQHDAAHHAKLQTFLQAVEAPQSWWRFHQVWNGIVQEAPEQPDLSVWGKAALQARERLIRQDDLTTRLLRFVESRQRRPDSTPQKS